MRRRAVLAIGLAAHRVKRQRVVLQFEALGLRYRPLANLDLGVEELFHPTTGQTHQMVMVLALVQLEHRLARLEMAAREYAGELIAAALELFVQRGFAATRLDDVAKRAGVSKGTLYLYFDSKEALFKAAIAEGLIPVLDDIDPMLETFTGGTSELMEALLLHWWRNVGATPLGGIPKLLISEARNFPDIAVATGTEDFAIEASLAYCLQTCRGRERVRAS